MRSEERTVMGIEVEVLKDVTDSDLAAINRPTSRPGSRTWWST
jgi:hypothetical protein